MKHCARCTVRLPVGSAHRYLSITYCRPCFESVAGADDSDDTGCSRCNPNFDYPGLCESCDRMAREATEDQRVDAYIEDRAEERSKK
jgi:hypothetical protein